MVFELLPAGGLREPLLEEGGSSQNSQDLSPEASPARVALEQRQPYSSRWLPFLLMHYLPFLAQLLIMWTSLQEGTCLIFACSAASLSFSGLFYTYVAWHTDAPGLLRRGFLPLSEQPLLLGILLAVPYGFLQWVIVALHLRDDTPKEDKRALDLEGAPENGDAEDDDDSGKFVTFKAVNAIVESLITSAAILYTHWTVGLPMYWTGGFRDHTFLMTLAELTIVASGGLGLLQLDYGTSQTVRDRMKAPMYKLYHCLLRTCEVISRLTILTGFAVMATIHSSWWWLLIAGEVGISCVLVFANQGLRNTWPAIFITVISATIVNIFCFVDDPFRFEAACKVSAGLTRKHLVETVLAGIFMFGIMDARLDFSLHAVTLATAVVANLGYWVLWWCICRRWSQEQDPHDNVFSATLRGDDKAVARLLTEGPAHFELDDYDINGMTPIMYAAYRGDLKVCRALLDAGASVQPKALDREGGPEEHEAHLDNGPLDLACCLKVRQWWWPPAGRQWNALHFAAYQGHVQVLHAMLTHNGRLNSQQALRATDVEKNTPLHVAGMFGQTEAYDKICEVGPQDWELLPNAFGVFPRRSAALSRPQALDLVGAPSLPVLGEPVAPLELAVPGEPVAPSEPREQVVISVTYDAPKPHNVPLGLASFAISRSSGQVGKLFKPPELTSEDSAAFEARQRGEGRELRLRYEDLQPCRKDGTRVPGAKPEDHSVSLGAGTFGHVWRVCDPEGNQYAVKRLRDDSGYCYTALRELQVVLEMQAWPHPCLVEAYLYHQLSNSSCIVFELCHGGTLEDVILEACGDEKRNNGWCPHYKPPANALWRLEEAFIAMEYLHRRKRINGIIRDFKLANVGLTYAGGNSNDPRGRAKLLDFGSYRLTGPSLGANTFAALNWGSPGYASPELLRNAKYTYHTDFYSFGVAIWVALTGGYEHEKKHQGKKAAQAWFSEHKSVRDLQQDWMVMQRLIEEPSLPSLGDAKPLVQRLLQEKPEKRGGHDEIRAALAQLTGRRLPAFSGSSKMRELEEALCAA